jgi:hypothetical protein
MIIGQTAEINRVVIGPEFLSPQPALDTTFASILADEVA